MTDISLPSIGSGFNRSRINSNFDEIEEVINNGVLHLVGGNNVLEQNIDMDSYRVLNLPDALASTEPVTLKQLNEALSGIEGAEALLPLVQPRQIGDGVTTTFSTPVTGKAGITSNGFFVYLDGVAQRPNIDYTISGVDGNITFIENDAPVAPNNGVKVDITYFIPRVLDPIVADENSLVTATGTPTPRTLGDRAADIIHVKDFGAQAYPYDSTAAIDAALVKAANERAYLHLDNLALKYVGSMNIPSGVKGIIGGSKTICWFGTLDDKKHLKEGEQDKLTGSILFSGTFDTFNTTRSDQFSSFTYMVKQSSQLDLTDVAFLQDMIVLDSGGNLTTPGNEGYSPCDVGFLIDDVGSNTYTNKCVWGYFDKAGTIIYSKSGNDDPDYNLFIGGSTYGRIGLAEIANDVGSPWGLSGTTYLGYKFGSLDHHSRNPTDAPTLYADADTWRCIYIDGDVEPATTAEINGHYLTNCVLRTRSDTIIELDRVSNFVVTGGVIEAAKYGITNSMETKFKASANTKKGVQFLGVRLNNAASIYNENFAGLIPYSVVVTGDPVAGSVVSSSPNPNVAGGYTISQLGNDRFTGDPFVVFGDNVTNSNAGWKILRDVSNNDQLQFRWDGVSQCNLSTTGLLEPKSVSSLEVTAKKQIIGDGTVLTISSGEITVTGSYHAVNTEASASTDDIDTISGGVVGQRLVIRALDQTRTVVLKNNTDNLRLAGDCILDNSTDTIELIYSGTNWLELSRSNNGA